MKMSSLNNRKIIKFAMLLLTSMLISFASVAAYTELFMHGNTITIGTASVSFTQGDDTTTMGGSDAINDQGTEVTFDQIPNIEPGEVRTYNEAVNITNGAGSTKTINISLYSLSGNWSQNFDYINITVIAKNGTAVGNTIKIVSSGSNVTSTGDISMPPGEEWAIKWVIKAKTTATNGQSITIVFKVEVD
ncbi:hypothetical protein J7L33_03555 [Candidatus Bathyarchaeota archaeon]|nr:hypothetical protein [Candidatus Bathyarchaeota archaeon]